MEYCKGVQKIKVFEDQLIIWSAAEGCTNEEEIIWLKGKLIEISNKWKGKKWAYIADISKLAVVPTEVSSELIKLHVDIFNNGCACLAFVEAEDAFISRQASIHNRMSNIALQEGHFNSFEQAFSWAKKVISL